VSKVKAFTLHNDRGMSIADAELLNWRKYYPDDKADIFGPITKYSWFVDDTFYEIQKPKGQSWEILPDASGFIVFEQKRWEPDNCLLLDAYGKERMRLTVPWQLTHPKNPESAKPPTSFDNIGGPYINPADGKQGKFGVTAWVEHAGKYYFELDYHTGQFLWGKEIRD
jgi:hypothetical protein